MKPLIVAAATLPVFAGLSAGALAQVPPVDRSLFSNNHRLASARFGRNDVHPNLQCIQTGTPWEPLS
jgi:hypothetical protein